MITPFDRKFLPYYWLIAYPFQQHGPQPQNNEWHYNEPAHNGPRQGRRSELWADNMKHLLLSCWPEYCVLTSAMPHLWTINGEANAHPTPWHHYLYSKGEVNTHLRAGYLPWVSFDPRASPLLVICFPIDNFDWLLHLMPAYFRLQEASPGIPEAYCLTTIHWRSKLILTGFYIPMHVTITRAATSAQRSQRCVYWMPDNMTLTHVCYDEQV